MKLERGLSFLGIFIVRTTLTFNWYVHYLCLGAVHGECFADRDDLVLKVTMFITFSWPLVGSSKKYQRTRSERELKISKENSALYEKHQYRGEGN